MNKNILIFGAGYVGLSTAIALSKFHNVYLIDIDKDKVKKIKNGFMPFFDNNNNIFSEQFNKIEAHSDISYFSEIVIDFSIIATPTDFHPASQKFDTKIVEECISKSLNEFPDSLIIIKSTVPIGFTNMQIENFNTEQIIFSPEFLREGFAISDAQNPSRIVVGSSRRDYQEKCLELLRNNNTKIESIFCSPSEAESIKLFSNAYLALRVAFFNELDSFSMINSLDPKKIIDGICIDPRIGQYHNNPSFGFGGYCLPKDTLQLETNFENVPQNIISSVINSNATRKQFIADRILDLNIDSIGIYKLSMKKDSDNFKESSILDIAEILDKLPNINIYIYEPLIKEEVFHNIKIIKNLEVFINNSEIIIANRFDKVLKKHKQKVFTRDIFGVN
jgi:UDPglucose 6-dehydrogenase